MKKILEALQIHREGGMHVITHHHASDPPEAHEFKGRNQAVGHILSHVDRLEPMGGPPQIEQEDSQADGGRPASFDHGSTRGAEMQGRKR